MYKYDDSDMCDYSAMPSKKKYVFTGVIVLAWFVLLYVMK